LIRFSIKLTGVCLTLKPVRYQLTQLKMLSFGFYATNAIIVSFLPIYLQYMDLSKSRIGIVLAVGPFATIFAQSFWGYMSDKYQTVKRMIQICLLGFMIFSIIFFNMESYHYIIIFAFFLFFFAVPIGALTDSLSQRMSMKLDVSFGSIRMWGSIGFAIASLTSGFILHQMGIDMILVLVLPLIISLLIVVLFIPEADYDENTKMDLSDLKQLLTNKRFILFLICTMFLSITQRGNDSFIGLYVTELGGFESQVGAAWSMALLGEAIAFFLSYLWFRKLHTIQFIMIAGIFYTIRWFSYSMVNEPNLLFALQLLNGPSFAVYYMSSFAYVSSILPKHVQSTGHLLFVTTFFGISGVISATAGGIILDYTSGSFMYMLFSISSVIGIILLLVYYVIFIKRKRSTKNYGNI